MTAKIIIIVGVSVATVAAMFLMGWFLNRDGNDAAVKSADGAGETRGSL